jgi:hypothetical protein
MSCNRISRCTSHNLFFISCAYLFLKLDFMYQTILELTFAELQDAHHTCPLAGKYACVRHTHHCADAAAKSNLDMLRDSLIEFSIEFCFGDPHQHMPTRHYRSCIVHRHECLQHQRKRTPRRDHAHMLKAAPARTQRRVAQLRGVACGVGRGDGTGRRRRGAARRTAGV